MQLKKGDIIEVPISDFAFGGVGVGKIKVGDGDFVVFVEGVIAGDIVDARLTKIKKQFAEAKFESFVKKSADRIAPRCKHFGYCGGCSLQFYDYAKQLEWKAKVVADSLARIGGFKDLKIEPIIGCDSPWFYRNKMEYSFGFDNHKPELNLGLHPTGRYQYVFDLEECFLESENSVKILRAVKDWVREKKLSGHDPRTSKGVLKNLVVKEGKNTNETMVNLVTNGKTFALEKEFKDWILGKFPFITSLYRTAVVVERGHKTTIEEFLLAGKEALTETLTVKIGKKTITLNFEIHPQAFFQPNTKQAEILYGKVLEFADPKAEDTILDLFCGTGTIGMFFAKTGARVIGIELSPDAIENAKNNAKTNGIENIQFYCNDITKFFEIKPQSLLPRPSILITDPPRAGIANSALEKILKLNAKKWVYVSCNPTTLARDLKIACENGYKIERVQPVDMFPQTYHIETVCLLRKIV